MGNTMQSGRRYVSGTGENRLNVPMMAPVAGQMFFGMMTNDLDIGALVDALVADNKAEMLANPHQLTLNHKPARIEMLEKYPYTEFGTEVGGRGNFSVDFLDIGIRLDVTPHVYQDEQGDYVRLELAPEVSFPVSTIDGVPIRSVRRSESEALARSGQTIVVGGIFKNDVNNVEQGVPVLSKIPAVGNLFKRVEKSRKQTELMVFVTPTIYKTPEAVTWDRMINLSQIDLHQTGILPEDDKKKAWE